MAAKLKAGGIGSPRWRQNGRHTKGEGPEPKAPRIIDTSEFVTDTLEAGRDAGAHEAVRYMRWYLKYGPNITKRGLYARELAKIGTPRPVVETKTQLTGTLVLTDSRVD